MGIARKLFGCFKPPSSMTVDYGNTQKVLDLLDRCIVPLTPEQQKQANVLVEVITHQVALQMLTELPSVPLNK